MTKKNDKKRTITFYSTKNKQIVSVNSEHAKKFAMQLENDNGIERYDTNVPLTSLKEKIDTTGFRNSTLSETWLSDFMVVKSGTPCIIEVVDEEQLEKKRLCAERLELSRRFWKAVGMPQWKVVILKRGETAW